MRKKTNTLHVQGRRCALLGLALTLLQTSVAAQNTEPRSLALAYEVPDSCPPMLTFEHAVTARTIHVRFDESGAAKVRLHIGRIGAEYNGRLETVLDGNTRVRTLRDASCEEVVDALALLTALSIDPEARAVPPPAPAPEPVDPPPPAPLPTAGLVLISQQRPPAPAAQRSPKNEVHVEWGTEVGGELVTGVGANPLLGVLVASPALRLGGSQTSPVLHIELGYALSSSDLIDVRLARARTWFFPITLEKGSLWVRPGIALGLGHIDATGTGALIPRTASELWAEALASLDARWMFNSQVFVGARAGLLVPLRDLAFVVDAQVVHRTEHAGLAASLSAGAMFP